MVWVTASAVRSPDARGAGIRAMPKSSTFTPPVDVIWILPGLMSRWMTPWLCASASAEATPVATFSVSSTLSGRSARMWRRLAPDTNSMAMNGSPPGFSSNS
jgi:hypothetical protein